MTVSNADEDRPLVSVVIPTYNRPHLLKRALDSVCRQSYNNIEVIVVDDASKEDIYSVISDYNTVKMIKHEKNQGASAARNTGIDAARGKYIAFLDSDDEWLSGKLEYQIDYMEKHDIGANFCWYYSCLDGFLLKHESNIQGDNCRKKMLAGQMGAITSTVIVRKDELQNCRFDIRLPSFQEYDFLLELTKHTKLYCFPKPLVITHHHSQDGISSNPKKREEGARLFFNKWKKEIVSEHDEQMYEDFYCNRYAGIHALYARQMLEEGQRLSAIPEVIKALKLSPINHMIYESLLEILIGKKHTSWIKRLYFKIAGNPIKNIENNV